MNAIDLSILNLKETRGAQKNYGFLFPIIFLIGSLMVRLCPLVK